MDLHFRVQRGDCEPRDGREPDDSEWEHCHLWRPVRRMVRDLGLHREYRDIGRPARSMGSLVAAVQREELGPEPVAPCADPVFARHGWLRLLQLRGAGWEATVPRGQGVIGIRFGLGPRSDYELPGGWSNQRQRQFQYIH